MMGRLVRRPASLGLLGRAERPHVALLALALAAVAGFGWFAAPFWLAVAVAVQLTLGGLGAVWLIGPATARLGFARYATLAAAGVALTLFGRLLTADGGLLFVPPAALLLWAVVSFELQANRSGAAGLAIDLAMVGIVFAAAAGVSFLVPPEAWPAALGLVLVLTAIPALRTAEARGRFGVEAVGQAALHLLGMGQIAAAVAMLQLPGVVGAALIALAFHAWSGAADALEGGSSARSVALEFGSLAVVGLVVALVLHGR